MIPPAVYYYFFPINPHAGQSMEFWEYLIYTNLIE